MAQVVACRAMLDRISAADIYSEKAACCRAITHQRTGAQEKNRVLASLYRDVADNNS